jgi:hypothetical protein
MSFGLLFMLSALVPSAIMLAAIVLSSSKLSAIDLSVIIILIVRYPRTSLQALLYTQHDDIQHNGTRLNHTFIYDGI